MRCRGALVEVEVVEKVGRPRQMDDHQARSQMVDKVQCRVRDRDAGWFWDGGVVWSRLRNASPSRTAWTSGQDGVDG
jgi:hypothetical protein